MLKSKKKLTKKTTVKTKPLPEDVIFQDKEKLLLFLNQMTKWLEEPLNYRRAINSLTKFDSNGDNKVSSDDFIIALRMAEIPATRLELKSLMKVTDLEDTEDGTVNISLFLQLLIVCKCKLQESVSESKHTDQHLSMTRASKKCSHCEIGMANPPLEIDPRYVKLKVVFAPFKTFPSHPGHFEQIVSDSTTVEGLKTIIQDHFDKAVTSVAIFKDDTCSKDSFMDPSWHLTCCGVKGASKADPVSVQVFYDYIPALQSCPILSDDSHLH